MKDEPISFEGRSTLVPYTAVSSVEFKGLSYSTKYNIRMRIKWVPNPAAQIFSVPKVVG